MQPLHERVRPKDWPEVVGQPKVVNTILRIRDTTGLAGRAYWLSGKSGQGKTTIGKLIAAEVADEWNIETYNATEFGVAEARRVVRSSYARGLGVKSGRAVIVNEAHALRNDVLVYLDDALEPIAPHFVWVFTTTREGQKELFADHFDAAPVLSRCVCLELTSRGVAEPMAKALQQIAVKYNLDGRPIEDYVKLVNDCRGNMRMGIGRIEAGCMMAEVGAA